MAKEGNEKGLADQGTRLAQEEHFGDGSPSYILLIFFLYFLSESMGYQPWQAGRTKALRSATMVMIDDGVDIVLDDLSVSVPRGREMGRRDGVAQTN